MFLFCHLNAFRLYSTNSLLWNFNFIMASPQSQKNLEDLYKCPWFFGELYKFMTPKNFNSHNFDWYNNYSYLNDLEKAPVFFQALTVKYLRPTLFSYFWGPAENWWDKNYKSNAFQSMFMKLWSRNNLDQLDR